MLAPFSIANSNVLSHEDLENVLIEGDGGTVFAGDDVIDSAHIKSYPSAINLKYLIHDITSGKFLNLAYGICTGVVSMPASEVVTGDVDKNGRANGFDGPGYVTVEGSKVNVHKPAPYTWGRIAPDTQAVKTNDGFDVISNHTGEVLGHVSGEAKEGSVESDINVSEINEWYKTAKLGSKLTLQFGVGSFSDNRSFMNHEDLKRMGSVYNYAVHHPEGDTIVVYTPNDTKYVEVSNAYTTLGSHPQYNDENRALNAKSFVQAWNNTIVPAHTMGCGRSDISFSAVSDSSASSGSATHGVCPPARALRSVVMTLGAPLPVGMDSGEDAVLFGYHPSSGVFVTNPLDYPIRITMWTEGSGTGMAIYARAEELVPANANVTSTNASTVELETVAN